MPAEDGRFSRNAALSVLTWVAAVSLAFWYLRGEQPAHVRDLPLTHADSLGLPLVAWALMVAGVLGVVNLGAVGVVRWRHRRRRPAASARCPAG